jgi:hypothetical protein
LNCSVYPRKKTSTPKRVAGLQVVD